MSEVVEYRLADLKSFIGMSVALIVLLFALTLIVLEWYLFGAALYLMAGLLAVVVQGRQTDGYARAFWEAIPGREYSQRPIKEWEQELEERGEL